MCCFRFGGECARASARDCACSDDALTMYSMARSSFSSMSTLARWTSSLNCCRAASSRGVSCLHGPHHLQVAAQAQRQYGDMWRFRVTSSTWRYVEIWQDSEAQRQYGDMWRYGRIQSQGQYGDMWRYDRIQSHRVSMETHQYTRTGP